jgi:hypothetical protein
MNGAALRALVIAPLLLAAVVGALLRRRRSRGRER